MIGKLKLQNIALFFVTVTVGVLMSYTKAHAGFVADFLQEPIDDFTSIVNEDLGNTMALLGVIVAIGIAWWQQAVWVGIMMVLVIGVLWSSMEYFA